MFKKKIIPLMLTAAFALSLMTAAIAASFTDLNGHWSKSYMEDLSQRGYLSGYEDGTMRPDNSITAGETLVLLSRFYELDSDAMDWIYSDYEAIVTSTVSSSLSWAYKQIAVCLAAGIISDTELDAMDLTLPIKKERLSVFLVRAMQLDDEAEALGTVSLDFSDAANITSAYRGDVKLLLDAGIVQGDDKNMFNPHSGVTRAVSATMISRALAYVETLGIDLVIEAYESEVRAEGIVTGVSGNKMTVRGFDGFAREYTIPLGTRITLNGTVSDLSTTFAGCYALVGQDEEGAVTAVSLQSDSKLQWAQGTVSRVSSTSGYTISVTNLDTGTVSSHSFTSSSNVVITKDGSTVSFAALNNGSFATVKVENGLVTEIRSYTSAKQAGTISSITYGTTVTLDITDGGASYRFLLDITNLPKITRGGDTISIDRIFTGDNVTVTFASGKVTLIEVEGAKNTVSGTLNSITTTATSTTWEIITDAGVSVPVVLANSVGVWSGDKSILLSSIQAGDRVTLVMYGGVAAEIYLEESTSSSTKVSGTVLSINTKDKEILILSGDKLIYVSTVSTGSIINVSTGKAVTLSGIELNSKILAYGTYSNSNTFIATSIIIEG